MLLEGVQIERQTIASQVANGLRTRILAGDIPPGTALTEEALARSFGVARSTIRETLAQLVAEGLLSRPSTTRILQVTKLTEADVLDIFVARRFLELSAVDAAAHASPDALRPLGDAVEAYAAASRLGDKQQLVMADMACHSALVSLLGSRYLTDVHAALLARLRLAVLMVEQPGDSVTTEALHREFYESLAAGDLEGARAQLQRRLDAAEEEFVALSRNA